MLLFNANSTFAPSAVLVCLTVRFLPPENSTVLPSVMFLAVLSESLVVLPVDLTLKPFIVPTPSALIVILPAASVETLMWSLPTTLTFPPTGLTSVPFAWIVQISSKLATCLVPFLVVYSIRSLPAL